MANIKISLIFFGIFVGLTPAFMAATKFEEYQQLIREQHEEVRKASGIPSPQESKKLAYQLIEVINNIEKESDKKKKDKLEQFQFQIHKQLTQQIVSKKQEENELEQTELLPPAERETICKTLIDYSDGIKKFIQEKEDQDNEFKQKWDSNHDNPQQADYRKKLIDEYAEKNNTTEWKINRLVEASQALMMRKIRLNHEKVKEKLAQNNCKPEEILELLNPSKQQSPLEKQLMQMMR